MSKDFLESYNCTTVDVTIERSFEIPSRMLFFSYKVFKGLTNHFIVLFFSFNTFVVEGRETKGTRY